MAGSTNRMHERAWGTLELMDVTCERCSTEYEFDETLLSGRGTSVKCTNCGHVFKVYPQNAEAPDPSTSSWRLRSKDGSVDAIDSLRELQRRIASGELTPDDQISRGGDGWKTLGSIPELETFFRAAGVPIETGRIPSPIPPAKPASRESSLPPGKRPRQPTLLGVSPVQRGPAAAAPRTPDPEHPPQRFGDWDEARAVASGSRPERAPEPAAESAGEPEAPAREEERSRWGFGDWESGAAAEPLSGESSYRSPYTRDSAAGPSSVEVEDAVFEDIPRSTGRMSTPPPGYYDDDDDIPELPGRATSPLRWLLLIVVIGAAALVASQWDRVARMVDFGSDPALIAAGIAEGDAALREGHPAAYASAIEAYARAIEAGAELDAELHAKLSNAYALAAQAQLDRGATGDQIEALVAGAESTAQRAAQLDQRDVSAQLALVDALRLRGELESARERLDGVRSMPFSRTPEFFRVEARLQAAEADGALEAGLRSAEEAVDLLDDDGYRSEEVRYRLLLARAELAAGNDERAQESLQAVLADHPQHPVATVLMAESQTLAASAEAGTEEAAGTAAETEAQTPAEAEARTEPEPAEGSEVETDEGAVGSDAPAPSGSGAEVEQKSPAQAEPSQAQAESPAASKPKASKRVSREPELDEYDRLAKAAGDDSFVDGRPPVIDYETNMTKGRQELAAGNYARARAYFDSALEVHPGSADAMDALGDVATEVSDYASALRYYRVAAQRGHPDGFFKLGETYERLGRDEEAVSAYYTYIKRRPAGTHVADARKAIKTLEPRAKLPPGPETPAIDEPAQKTESLTP